MLRTQNGPLVVLDRCVLAYQRIERFVPPDAQYVLPDAFFYEAMTGSSPEVEAPRFNSWAAAFANRLFFARTWGELSRLENEPGAPVAPDSIIHRELSHALRSKVMGAGLDWSCAISGDLEPERSEREQQCEAFNDLCALFSDAVLNQHSQWTRRMALEDSKVDLVRQPAFITSFIQQHNERLRGPEWARALSVFPDEHAVARWMRLIAWYAVQHSVGHVKRFENNYFDAEYAFTASYVGRLATTDNALITATRAVFPQVQILSQPM